MHLFLALLIAATPPAPDDVVATLHGKPILRRDAPNGRQLLATVFGRLLEDFAQARNIDVMKAELDAHMDRNRRFQQEMLAGCDKEESELRGQLGAAGVEQRATLAMRLEEQTRATAMVREYVDRTRKDDRSVREIGRRDIRSYKVNQLLWAQYGDGRVIFQQFGPEPLDADRRFLEEKLKSGDFSILDPSIAPAFWEYFTSEAHTVIDSEEAKRLMTTPWWMAARPHE